MKKFMLAFLTLCFSLSLFAQETQIGSLQNRKTKETLKIMLDGETKELRFVLDTFGVQDEIAHLRYRSLSDVQGLELSTDVYSFKIISTTTNASGNVFRAIGSSLGAYFEWCNDETDWMACAIPLPTAVVVVPGIAGGLSVAGAVTFIAGIVASPVDATITGVSHIFSKKANAKRKLKKAMQGKQKKMSDRSFKYLVQQLNTMSGNYIQ